MNKRRFLEWTNVLGRTRDGNDQTQEDNSSTDVGKPPSQTITKWNMGILNDSQTEEVPGSILLLSKVSEFNEPLGLRNAPARTSASSLPSPYPSSLSSARRRSTSARRRLAVPEKKRTADGKVVLEPQPDDSLNDPLNWAVWRRDSALVSLGFYCMVGGGMTTVLSAGFNDVAREFDVTIPQVALTTGLYMLGLGLGSVVLSPTAILFGKRPVYLIAAFCFAMSAVWCALSPNFPSLIVARIFMGFAVSSVECLPSATVAEIYFLHEKAYRLGIYTLLLLGGKNIVPLVSAAITETLHWRWVFWIIAMVVGFGLVLLFFFVPETFWDRSPQPRRTSRFHNNSSNFRLQNPTLRRAESSPVVPTENEAEQHEAVQQPPDCHKRQAHFETESEASEKEPRHEDQKFEDETRRDSAGQPAQPPNQLDPTPSQLEAARTPQDIPHASEKHGPSSLPIPLQSTEIDPIQDGYTAYYQSRPQKTFRQQLKPWSGRLSHDNWFRVAARPFILFAYPAVLWSTLVYSLSVGWLIVLSESVSTIYESRNTYNFNALQAGLIFISPFVGGILGTAVAGKCSDILVRFLARRNGGIYEPEFRLFMGIPIAIFTTIGLMGYGWSAAERDAWIVPTVFFGFISFGCSLGSTTAITFAVDSYRQYAGEALVTLNFSKNIFHGLVFSLFFNTWLQSDGSKEVFITIGGIQLACLLTTIPMYIFGKRARMWTVRKNLMEKF